MSLTRWDIHLRFVDGHLARGPELVLRGPSVELGTAPQGAGYVVRGYRGIGGRHAVLTVYEGDRVQITPVGNCHVRVSSCPEEDWTRLDPIHRPVDLADGDHIHLGPPDGKRGATLIFLRATPLGCWRDGPLSVEGTDEHAGGVGGPVGGERLEPRGWLPSRAVAIVCMLAFAAAVLAILITFVAHRQRTIAGLDPSVEGRANYEYASPDDALNEALYVGLDQAFHAFVMRIDADAAGDPALATDRALWDSRLREMVTRAFDQHTQGWRFYQRLEAVAEDYAHVVMALREAGLPEVFAGIPYRESLYQADAQSNVCARGWWQFMPETARRFGLDVRDCRLRGTQVLWTPSRLIPVRAAATRAPYVEDNRCRIIGCDGDERQDLEASTSAALAYLREPWQDPELRASGALVQLVITAFNAGYDDSRFEERDVREGNVLPAYRTWLRQRGLERAPDFLGQNIKCPTDHGAQNTRCGSLLYDQSQHYAYSAIAQHLAAVCYYAQNHREQEAFAPWTSYLGEDGYCSRVAVPTGEQVRARHSSPSTPSRSLPPA